MSSTLDALGARGNQTPTFSVFPPYHRTEATDAIFLASRYGLTADPWQRTVLEPWLGVRPDGHWSAPRPGDQGAFGRGLHLTS